MPGPIQEWPRGDDPSGRVGWLVLLVGLVAITAGRPVEPPGRPAAAAPQIRIEPVASLDSLPLILGEPGAWSPVGALLALRRGPNQVWVFDASRPGAPPRMVHDAGQWVRSCGWSPDGGWLLLLVGDAHPRDLRMLVAVPLDGGRPDTLRSEEKIWRAFWGPDGLIHYKVPMDWPEALPPARWKPPATFVPRQPLALDMRSGLELWFHRVDPRQAFDLVCLGDLRHDGIQLRVLDMIPDGSRFLVAISEDTTGAMRLVDRDGRTLLDLRRAGIRFEPTAISADGRMIVGFGGEGGGEQGYLRTWIEAADAGGRWSTRVSGGEGAQAPQLSREGSFIAYRTARGTAVGRLVIEGR